jgi:hypothetical protein
MNTAKQIRDKHPKSGSIPLDLIEKLYELGDLEIEKLSKKPSIDIGDIQNLERRGKCIVADILFSKCTKEAQSALLNDSHHFVRSTAKISQIALTK